MTVNESTTDRVIRGGVALAALAAGTAVGGVTNPVGIALYGVAGVAAFTAVSGFCPIYTVLGISTAPQLEEA